VQTFAGPGTPNGPTAGTGKPLSPAEQTRVALRLVNERRKSAGVPPLKMSEPLTEAARSMLQTSMAGDLSLPKHQDIYSHLAPAEKDHWASLSLLGGACGGCGTAPKEADVDYFIKQWLNQSRYAKMLMDADATHLGFAVAANGDGKKVALGLLGQRR
jgi:uncharacterized protein YkwD